MGASAWGVQLPGVQLPGVQLLGVQLLEGPDGAVTAKSAQLPGGFWQLLHLRAVRPGRFVLG